MADKHLVAFYCSKAMTRSIAKGGSAAPVISC
jgi:hypothetical protein